MINLKSNPFYLDDAQCRWVADTLSSMTDEEKIGQLFCVMGGGYGKEQLKDMVRHGRVGGILYRPAPAQEIRDNYAPLDEAAKIPLLKAANLEEGGSGIITDGTLYGWPMLVAAAGDADEAERFGEVCAAEGRSVGINWTFSPVCDLDLNFRNPITNVRTFGSDTDTVLGCAEKYVKAVQKRGIAACAKHFPGDGVDFRDQHLHPTYNSLSAEDWYGSYGKIYERLIGDGLMSVMVGHICQPSVSMDINPGLSFADCLPASLSPELLQGVLRKRYGFNGVITTDATIMAGFTMAMERRSALPAAIMAGCDMLVFNTDFEEDFLYLAEGLRNGLLTKGRLDEAVERILALKACVCFGGGAVSEVPSKAWHRECADRAITLVKNTDPEILPITPERYPDIRLALLGKDNILDGSVGEIAKKYLEEKGFYVEIYAPFEDDLHGTSGLSASRLTLYLANYETASNQTTVRAKWCDKHALDTPRYINEEKSVFVSLANPYLLQDVPRIKTYVNAYTATYETITLTIDKLMGLSQFKGVSPVDAFCGLPDARL